MILRPSLAHAFTACLLFSASSAIANGYDEVPNVINTNVTLLSATATPAQKLKAAANANPHLEWHDGAEGEADSMVMLSDVLFEFGTARLSPAAIDTLSIIASELPGVPALEIVGHTDSVGTEIANLRLAEARAQAVKIWLVANSPIHPDTLSTIGMGEAEPIAENQHITGDDNPEGRALNRRVEFHLPKHDGDAPAQSS